MKINDPITLIPRHKFLDYNYFEWLCTTSTLHLEYLYLYYLLR